MTAKTLFTGTAHVSAGPEGRARTSDGRFDFALPEPHPAAEQLFAAAWSACYLGAIGFVAQQRKLALPAQPEVETTVKLSLGETGFQLSGRLDVTLKGLDRDVALELIDAAHAVCPYSKAVHGNIEVETNLVEVEAFA
ncbi:Ohr family peroxiredoxin [Sphingomonas sp.]|uniref:Ohr family peroxiredoxin n=1 Tax=Sphingomonas sp. TaxID=28214 RepID=UPI001B127084|nr:Ohr family peroxiredoxin [Sphingomonas sp.]MBO9711511.1 Ohr family peroxiredoxin [Sphingomonas sp.]